MSMELIDKRKLIEKVKTFHKWSLYTDNFPLIPSKRYGVGYLADNVLFGIDSEPTVKAIPIERLEQIRAEILDKYPDHQCTGELTGYAEAIEDILEIIDKALKEVSNETN